MKLRRHRPPPEIPAAFLETVADTYFAFEEALATCARLTRAHEDGASVDDLRDEALEAAQGLAGLSRLVFESHGSFDMALLTDEIFPLLITGAIARLMYAFTALAEEDPVPEQFLSLAEIDGLIGQYELGDWMTRCRERNPNWNAT